MPYIRITTCATLLSGAVAALACADHPTNCSASVVDSSPMQLANGSFANIQATSAVRHGNSVLITGRTEIGSTDSTIRSPDALTPLIGVLVSDSGTTEVLQSPLPSGKSFYAQAAVDDADGWHFVLVDSARSLPTNDTARTHSRDLWYAHYRTGTWTNVEKLVTLANVRNSLLSNLEIISNGDSPVVVALLGRDFDFESEARMPPRGLLTIQRVNRRWSFDTLATPFALSIDDFHLARDSARGGITLFSTPTPVPRKRYPGWLDLWDSSAMHSFLSLTQFRDGWSEPVHLIAPTARFMGQPKPLRVGGQALIAWVSNSVDSPWVQSQPLDENFKPLPQKLQTLFSYKYGFTGMRLDQRSALWIGREHQNNLTLVVQTRDQLLRLPQLELPNSGRGFTAVRMGDNQFAYLTSNRAVTGSDLHETSALAKVHVTCK